MLDNYDLKPAKLDEVIEVFSEFSNLNEDDFSTSELFNAAHNFIEISRGKIAKDKVRETGKVPTSYSRDTYLVMTKSPWKNMYDYHQQNQLIDYCCLDWNKGYSSFEEINQGWS